MINVTSIELTRDCDAVQIPIGTALTLPKGTPVDITQTLGGSYTVHAQGGLYRISAKDADALNIEVGAAPDEAKEARPPSPYPRQGRPRGRPKARRCRKARVTALRPPRR